MTKSKEQSNRSQRKVYSIDQDAITNVCHTEDTTGDAKTHNVLDKTSSHSSIEAWTEESLNKTDGRRMTLG